jgi:hypothetical protein
VDSVDPDSPGEPPVGCGHPCGVGGDGLFDPVLPLGDGWGGNGDSLPLLSLGLELGLELGLPPELDGEEDGGDELGGWGVDGDCTVVVQPASAADQATASRSLAMSLKRMDSSLQADRRAQAGRSSI